LKSSHNGIALADLDGRLTYVNDAFLKMWGYEDGGKMLGKSAIGFWQETDRARDIIIDLFDKGNWEGEMAAVKSDGSEFDVHLSASMVLDKDGNPCCMMASFIDITERKRAERAVKENEQKMKALLNATNNPEVLLAPGGIILTLNETAATVFGGRPDEFIGKNIGNFVPPEQYEYMRVQSSNVRAMEKPLHLETENNNRIYDTCIYPVFDAEDNATAVAICSIDIEQKMRALLNATKNPEILLDYEGTILTLNDAAAKWLNGRTDELIGQKVSPLVSPEVNEVMRSNGLGVFHSGKSAHFEITVNGRILDTCIYPAFDAEGKVWAVALYFNNVTKRRQAEEALRESEQKYRTLVENIPDAVWTADQDAVSSFLSSKIEKIYGGTPRDIFDRPLRFFDRVHPDDVEYVKKEYELLFKKKKKLDVQYRLQRRDGRWIWVHDRSMETYEKNGVTYADGIISDITEIKESELALQKKEWELEVKAKRLLDANTALEVLLRKRDDDRLNFEKNILYNVRELVMPYFQKLRQSGLNDIQATYISILESMLQNLTSPFSRKVSSKSFGLTPAEIQVADLVKRGRTTKDIAKLLHCSDRAIEFHRSNIRKKLGLIGYKGNLRSYLLSID